MRPPQDFSLANMFYRALVTALIIHAERCSNSNIGDVRLVGSANMTEGRLEICVNDYWGTVCNDQGINNDRQFDRNATVVVCRQLGFPESGETIVLH